MRYYFSYFGSMDNISEQIFYISISESFLLTSVSHRHLIRGPVSTKRRGPTPLITWLKADDQFLNVQNPNLKIIHPYVVLCNVPNLLLPTKYDIFVKFLNKMFQLQSSVFNRLILLSHLFVCYNSVAEILKMMGTLKILKSIAETL